MTSYHKDRNQKGNWIGIVIFRNIKKMSTIGDQQHAIYLIKISMTI